jgi:outer membrane beta-barrel protein
MFKRQSMKELLKRPMQKVAIVTMILIADMLSATSAFSVPQDKRFKDFEIRVIRPKFFSKSGKFELGAQGSVITNQTFIYTFMASGLATMHFTESLGLEVSGAYGFSIDKDDKTTLKETFDINTIILRTQYILGGNIVFTPIYGKFQTDEGRLIYFDTFVSFGAGMTGVEYIYDHCEDPATAVSPENVPTPPEANTQSYLTFMGGIGQRFFLSKSTSLRWDIKGMMFSYSSLDGSCDPEFEEETIGNQQNVTIQIGTSKFF